MSSLTDYLYAHDTLTSAQFKQMMKRLRRHEKLGFYVEVDCSNNDKYDVKLYGPTIYWKKTTVMKTTWEIRCKQKPDHLQKLLRTSRSASSSR